MRHITQGADTLPRLLVEDSPDGEQLEIGYVQLGQAGPKIEVGSATGREFRLMQCLFSPRNFLSAKYEPVVQTYERVFSAMRLGATATPTLFAVSDSTEREMAGAVERSLRNLRRAKIGEHFSFVCVEGKVRLEAVAA